METSTTTLLDLPVEIILQLFPSLDVNSFLNLTSTCKTLHHPNFHHDWHYWSRLVRTDFRVPNQPVVQNDGRRWQSLYKRMLTQTKVYTWGDNGGARLGHSWEVVGPGRSTSPASIMRIPPNRESYSCPARMYTRGIGVISDIQCGGWSTTLLTAKGVLYTVGIMNGTDRYQTVVMPPMKLVYSFEDTSSDTGSKETSTAIRQFSAGRTHVLGLTDSGAIWSWQNSSQPGLKVKFLDHDVNENGEDSGQGTVIKVVAGWNMSGALIKGSGIVIWEPVWRDNYGDDMEDAGLVLESAVVPNTQTQQQTKRTQVKAKVDGATLPESLGEVRNFILLESFVLFNTTLGKVYAASIVWDNERWYVSRPCELPVANTLGFDSTFVTDVQGSFRSFAIFTDTGDVLMSDQDRLYDAKLDRPVSHDSNSSSFGLLFVRIPALQTKNVISIAFGDYHFHALHSNGHITSFGKELNGCGALGLGGRKERESRLRGLYVCHEANCHVLPHAHMEGRRIWFEREKWDWIKFLSLGGADPTEAGPRIAMMLDKRNRKCLGEVSEWIEQQGRDWGAKLGVQTEDDDGICAYWALCVTAAGWHSGALILENESFARKLHDACMIPDTDSTNDTVKYGQQLQGIPPRGDTSVPGLFDRAADQDLYSTTGVSAWQDYEDVSRPIPDIKYCWADDHFPRLRLSDGREMPGSVPFDEWRHPRPVFDLDIEF